MRLISTVALAIVLTAIPATQAFAVIPDNQEGGGQPPADDEFGIEVGTPGSETPGTPGGETGGPIPCSWSPTAATPEFADLMNGVTEIFYDIINEIFALDLEVTITFYSEEGDLRAWDALQARFERSMIADCTTATVPTPGGWVTGDVDWWAVLPPSPTILLPGALARATAPIGDPRPAINPPDATAINLGMWLAVEEAGPITIRVALGPVWAEATATAATSTYDFGSGAPVVCAGNGTPLPPSARNRVEQGPCGYTFRDADDVGDTQITVTSIWDIAWRMSDGTSGTQPSIDASTTIPYEVYEIQTVGRSG